MKILCTTMDSHDINWTYYDTEERKIYYFLSERECGVKNCSMSVRDIFSYVKQRFNFNMDNPEHITIMWQCRERYSKLFGIDSNIVPRDKTFIKLDHNKYVVDHHYAHVLSALAINDSANQGVAIDGMGDWSRRSMVYRNIKDPLNTEIIEVDKQPSFGKCFRQIGAALNIKKNLTELKDYVHFDNINVGKIMGLQSYGEIDNNFYNTLESSGYLYGDNWKKLKSFLKNEFKGIDIYNPNDNFDKIATTYKWLSENIVKVFDRYIYKDEPVVYAGGCALSTVANEYLINAGYKLTVCPAAGDSGLSLGLLKFADLYFNLNIDFSNLVHTSNSDLVEHKDMSIDNIRFAAKVLAEGKIIAFVNGPGEVGPRALGHRSILMNPAIPNGKDFINDKVKHREWWRPFGGSTINTNVIKNYVKSDLDYYMLRNFEIAPEWKEKLNSIVHIDDSCRLQVLTDKSEPLYKVISEFERLTGIPAVLNTSFNDNGKPIPHYKKHILETYKNLDNLDYLFYDDWIYTKNEDGSLRLLSKEEIIYLLNT